MVNVQESKKGNAIQQQGGLSAKIETAEFAVSVALQQLQPLDVCSYVRSLHKAVKLLEEGVEGKIKLKGIKLKNMKFQGGGVRLLLLLRCNGSRWEGGGGGIGGGGKEGGRSSCGEKRWEERRSVREQQRCVLWGGNGEGKVRWWLEEGGGKGEEGGGRREEGRGGLCWHEGAEAEDGMSGRMVSFMEGMKTSWVGTSEA